MTLDELERLGFWNLAVICTFIGICQIRWLLG